METSGKRAIEKNSLVKKVAQFDLKTVLGFSGEGAGIRYVHKKIYIKELALTTVEVWQVKSWWEMLGGMETQKNVVAVVQGQSAVEPGLADAADEGQSPFAVICLLAFLFRLSVD